jgi:hypothetical protein
LSDDLPNGLDFWHSTPALHFELERLKDRFGEAALAAALERFKRSRGHPPQDDEAALLAMRIIIADNPDILPWQAACSVATGANGTGTLENTKKRLVGKFKENADTAWNIKEIIGQYLWPTSLFQNLHNIGKMIEDKDKNISLSDLFNEVVSFQNNLFAWSYSYRVLDKAFSLSEMKPPTLADLQSMLASNDSHSGKCPI